MSKLQIAVLVAAGCLGGLLLFLIVGMTVPQHALMFILAVALLALLAGLLL